MAKLTQDREEELMKRAASLRDEMNKVIARQEFMAKEGGKTLAQHAQDHQRAVGKLQEQIIADKANDFQTSLNDAFTDAITYGTGAVNGAGAVKLKPQVPYKSQEQWLEETQSMRVVALNEACGVAKAMIEDSVGVTPEHIAKMAYTFAKFLTEGQA